MNANIPTKLSIYDSFDELDRMPTLTHFATWIGHDDSLVIDLFTEDDDSGQLIVRYNGVTIAVYSVNAQECDDYIVSLEEVITLKGSPRYNKLRGI